jgi:hypothetical protein
VRSRSAILFCLILLLFALTSRASSSLAASAPDIGLGFGPSNVQPVAEGIPIYTQGDNIWVESYYNSTIYAQLLSPDGSQAASSVVEPGQLSELYSLAANDASGDWTITITALTGTTSIHLSVVSPDSSMTPAYQGANLTENRLNQLFALPPTDAYNLQACSAGQSIGSAVTLRVAGADNGTIQVSLGQNASQLSVSQTPVPFETWFELYSQYSYSLNGKGTVSQNLLVASTPIVSVSALSAGQSLPWITQLPMREGRYDLRVYERNSAGLSLQDAPFLRTSSGSWVSLDSCTSMVDVYSRDFALTINLDSSNSSWPRYLITMYDVNGVEAYSESDVPGAEAAIHLKAFPNGGPLTGVVITASAPGLLTSDWDSYASSVYVLTSGLAGKITVTLSYSGVVTQDLNFSITGSYVSKSLSIPAGTLNAMATLQGKALTNATLSVAAPGSQPRVLIPSSGGVVSILLPPNNYTISASYMGTSRTEVIPITAGHTGSASLDLSQAFPVLLYALAALGVAGLVVNVFVWRQYIERRKIYG